MNEQYFCYPHGLLPRPMPQNWKNPVHISKLNLQKDLHSQCCLEAEISAAKQAECCEGFLGAVQLFPILKICRISGLTFKKFNLKIM
jgi:hypothetical protein